MSNYGPSGNNDVENRSTPRDTSDLPNSPVKDVFGNFNFFGGENPFEINEDEEVDLLEFTQQVKDKFHGIWDKINKGK